MAEDRPNNRTDLPLNDGTSNGHGAEAKEKHDDNSVNLLDGESSDSEVESDPEEVPHDFNKKTDAKNFLFLNIKLDASKKVQNEMKQDLEEQRRLTKKYERMLLQERVQNTSIRNRLHAKEQEQHTMSQKFKTQYLEEKNWRIASDKTFKMQYKTLKETHLDVVTTKDQAIKELKALVKGLKKDVSQHEKKSEKNEQKIEQLQQAKSKLSADIMTALKTRDLYKKEATLFQRDLLKMKKEESLWSKKNLDHQQKMASIELEKLKTKKELEKMKVSLLDK